MYTSSIPCSCNDVNIALVCTESNAVPDLGLWRPLGNNVIEF